MSGDENTNSNQLVENPITPVSQMETDLKKKLLTSEEELHKLKIENEKNSQLFQMFD